MALVSPGVEVTVIDESQYIPSSVNTVPYFLIATAQNKVSGDGITVAAGTLAANANKTYLITSQRDLTATFGVPFFYKTTAGTPINGYELNEYGLLAAYSALGVTNRCYVLRCDIDLASLVGQTGRPTGAPADGTYWLDSTTSTWGIYEFNQTTGQFALQSPIVITDSTNLSGGVPLASIGAIGDYAVNALQVTNAPTGTDRTYYYKTTSNVWVELGSPELGVGLSTIIVGMYEGQTRTAKIPGRYLNNQDESITQSVEIILNKILSKDFTEGPSKIKIFDDILTYYIPYLCGEEINFEVSISEMDGTKIFQSKPGEKINYRIGDNKFPMIFSYSLFNKMKVGTRTIISPGTYFRSFDGSTSSALKLKTLDSEYYMIDIYTPSK
jgi:hypothetical protein